MSNCATICSGGAHAYALTVTNSQAKRVINADCARMIEGSMIDLKGWYVTCIRSQEAWRCHEGE